MLGDMIKNAVESAVNVVSQTLDIGRAYPAGEAAAIFDVTVEVLDGWVREGLIKPVFPDGDRSYSGFVIAKLLGWPLSEDSRDYMLGRNPVGMSVPSMGLA